MGNIKVVLNRAGVRELLRSPEMMDICAGYANNALSRLGAGYEVTTQTGKNRVNAQIAAIWRQTRAANSRDNTILKALRG